MVKRDHISRNRSCHCHHALEPTFLLPLSLGTEQHSQAQVDLNGDENDLCGASNHVALPFEKFCKALAEYRPGAVWDFITGNIDLGIADGFGVCIPQHCPWLLTTFQLGIVSRPRREMFILMLRSRRRMVSDLSLDYLIYYTRCTQAFVTQQKSWQHTRSRSIIIP